MRANAIENALKQMVEITADIDDPKIQNIRTKSLILLDRNAPQGSVIREFINGNSQ